MYDQNPEFLRKMVIIMQEQAKHDEKERKAKEKQKMGSTRRSPR